MCVNFWSFLPSWPLFDPPGRGVYFWYFDMSFQQTSFNTLPYHDLHKFFERLAYGDNVTKENNNLEDIEQNVKKEHLE